VCISASVCEWLNWVFWKYNIHVSFIVVHLLYNLTSAKCNKFDLYKHCYVWMWYLLTFCLNCIVKNHLELFPFIWIS
jgi:hypothetical protein